MDTPAGVQWVEDQRPAASSGKARLGEKPPLDGASEVTETASKDTSLDLATALQWTLSGNPNLLAVRQSLPVSAEAIEVARRLPVNLNPTLSVDTRPWTFERVPGDGVQRLQGLLSVSLSQPLEFGHRSQFRESIAQSEYCHARWTVVQAELTALVQTYRLHQTAVYRRQRLAVAERLVEFNRQLIAVLGRRVEANQAAAADLVLAEVESSATLQQCDTARVEYLTALTDLREQIGIPEYAATLEPAGQLGLPPDDTSGRDEELVRKALSSRPEIGMAQAALNNSCSAVGLARADRIPVPSLGPVYEKDESGVTYYGMALSSPLPVLNAGRALVAQREAEYHRDCVALEQTRRQVLAQVRAALTRWRRIQELAGDIQRRMAPIQAQSARMERLYEAGQTDLVKLLQVRQRLIESENAQLDAAWQATQAYADLLVASGVVPLINSGSPPEQVPRPSAQ